MSYTQRGRVSQLYLLGGRLLSGVAARGCRTRCLVSRCILEGELAALPALVGAINVLNVPKGTLDIYSRS